jgi:transcriptional regulator with XRE-family HTH domain
MGTLYKNAILSNIVALGESCTPKVSPSKMCTDLGLSRSLVTKLKENPDRTINGATAQKIADYFGVSVDCVLGSSENKKSTTPEGMVLTENQKYAINLVMKLSEEQLRNFSGLIESFLETQSSK